jgi:hypothetical protein
MASVGTVESDPPAAVSRQAGGLPPPRAERLPAPDWWDTMRGWSGAVIRPRPAPYGSGGTGMTEIASSGDAIVCLLALQRRSDLGMVTDALVGGLDAGSWLWWRVAVADEDAARIGGQFGSPAFDIVVELGVPAGGGRAAEAAVATAVTAIGNSLDPARSELLIGSEYILRPGRGRFVLYWCMKRRRDIEPGHYRRHMLTTHAEFGLTIPGQPGYGQVHIDPDGPDPWPALGLRRGLADSVSRVEFADVAAVEAARPSEERLKVAAADGELIGDTSLSLVAFLAEVAGSHRDGE